MERELELNLSNEPDKLLKLNNDLEVERGSANKQIERLLENYKTKNSVLFSKELEFEFRTLCSALIKENLQIQLQESDLKCQFYNVETEKILISNNNVNLKQRISEQVVEIINLKNRQTYLEDKLNALSSQFNDTEKLKLWYKEQLKNCQNDKVKLSQEFINFKNKEYKLNHTINELNLNLSKSNCEINEVKIQLLQEKSRLNEKKLENTKLDCLNSSYSESNNNNLHKINEYSGIINELNKELQKLQVVITQKDEKIKEVNQENSAVISKCIILQQKLKEKEQEIEFLNTAKIELLRKLKFGEESDKKKNSEILEFKTVISKLKSELELTNSERKETEHTVEFIRTQFLKFKQNYDKLKNELQERTKQVFKLDNNWKVLSDRELENNKQKDVIIEQLKREKKNIKHDLEHLKIKNKSSDEKLNYYYDQYVSLNKELHENKENIKDLENNKLKKADIFSMDEKTSIFKQLKPNREAHLYPNGIELITDDQKVELLNKLHKKITVQSLEQVANEFLKNLNIEEFQNTVDEKITTITARVCRITNNSKILKKTINIAENSAIIEKLEILVQVKNREIQERQKKMDRNNRVLLRTVKELMSSQNFAEKKFGKLFQKYEYNTGKYRAIILDLDEKLNALSKCEKCVDLSRLKSKFAFFETYSEELALKNVLLETENAEINKKLESYLNQKSEYLEVENLCLKCNLEDPLKQNENLQKIGKLKRELLESKENIQCYSKEIQLRSLNLQPTVEPFEGVLEEFHTLKLKLDEYRNLNNSLQNEIILLNKERFFFQRLSNDLKSTLNSYRQSNEHLQKSINRVIYGKLVSRNNQEKFPNYLNLEKFDDEQINKVLAENQNSSIRINSLTIDFQTSLDNLKSEIFNFEKQFIRKNCLKNRIK